MAIIAALNPCSIRTLDDVVVAFELVLADLFRDVGSLEGRAGNVLRFSIDEGPLDGFQVAIRDYDADPIGPDERAVLEAMRRLDLRPEQVIFRMTCEPDGFDEAATMADALREIEKFEAALARRSESASR